MVKWINTTASVSDQKRLAVAPGYQHDPRLEELRDCYKTFVPKSRSAFGQLKKYISPRLEPQTCFFGQSDVCGRISADLPAGS